LIESSGGAVCLQSRKEMNLICVGAACSQPLDLQVAPAGLTNLGGRILQTDRSYGAAFCKGISEHNSGIQNNQLPKKK